MVPEQLLEADLPATAVRLYGLLLRCPVVDGAHVQSRARLAERLHRSLDTVDRAVAVLVDAGWIQVAHRFSDGQQIANAYVVMPTPTDGHDEVAASEASVTAARVASVDNVWATAGHHAPVDGSPARDDSSASLRGSRTSAARGAALMRHGRESLTQRTSSPSPPHHLHHDGGDSSAALQRLQQPAQLWLTTDPADARRRERLVRQQAWEELAAGGQPVSRAAVTRRACELLGAQLARP